MSAAVKAYAWIAAFFAIGAVVGLFPACEALDRGAPLVVAIFVGAWFGALAVTVVPFVGLRLWSWLHKPTERD